MFVCKAALSFGSFHILVIEFTFHGNNVWFSVEDLEAVHTETNFALVTLKNIGFVKLPTGSPTMQGIFWRYL